MASMFKTTLLLGGNDRADHGDWAGIWAVEAVVEIAFVFAIAMNFFSYWFSDKMVLRAYGAQPLDASRRPGALFDCK